MLQSASDQWQVHSRAWRLLLLGLAVFCLWSCSAAAAQEVTIYLFSAKGCLHCQMEKQFLTRLQAQDPAVKIVELELTEHPENQELFRKVAAHFRYELLAVPFTVVGNSYLVGWQGEGVSGPALKEAIVLARAQQPPDVVAALRAQIAASTPASRALPDRLRLPLLGEVEWRRLPLVVLTIIFGALDGFNPCAMWALVFLIGLLVNLGDRWRLLTLGTIFIAGSGVVYFLFLAAWLNLLLLLGLVFWIRLGIGLVAIVAAAFNLRQFFRSEAAACPLNDPRRQGILARLRQTVGQRSFLLAALGVFGLGLAVNLVELFCSAGLPVIYTQILALSNLPTWQYYLYLVLYVVIFMLDDLLVFVASLLTLQQLNLGGSYQRWGQLFGGLVLLVVGLLLIFRPEALSFG